MTLVAKFTFNPFQENTYVLHDDTRQCVIIDPGCQTPEEENELRQFISSNHLTPVRLVNTHCHLDHVFGNNFIFNEYGLLPECHQGEQQVLDFCLQVSKMYNIAYTPSPSPKGYLSENDKLTFGNSSLDILFTPGHSPASISFYAEADKFLIAGDVLFNGSIGRTDLPGGNFDTLANSIRTQLYTLPDDVIVFSGHGPETKIGVEKQSNPFVKA